MRVLRFQWKSFYRRERKEDESQFLCALCVLCGKFSVLLRLSSFLPAPNSTTISSMAITAVYEPQRTGSAEKFFQAYIYLLLVTGFTALTSTGKLDRPSLAILAPPLFGCGRTLGSGQAAMISGRG